MTLPAAGTSQSRRTLPFANTDRLPEYTIAQGERVRLGASVQQTRGSVQDRAQHEGKSRRSMSMAPARRAAQALTAPVRGLAELLLLPRRSEEHTSELQSRVDLVCRLL